MPTAPWWIQIRPRRPDHSPEPPRRPPPAPPQTAVLQWLGVYVPVLIVVGFVLYVLCELLLRTGEGVPSLARPPAQHLAFRTVQRQLVALPAVPLPPPPAAAAAAVVPARHPSATSLRSLHSYVLAV